MLHIIYVCLISKFLLIIHCDTSMSLCGLVLPVQLRFEKHAQDNSHLA